MTQGPGLRSPSPPAPSPTAFFDEKVRDHEKAHRSPVELVTEYVTEFQEGLLQTAHSIAEREDVQIASKHVKLANHRLRAAGSSNRGAKSEVFKGIGFTLCGIVGSLVVGTFTGEEEKEISGAVFYAAITCIAIACILLVLAFRESGEREL